MATQVVHVKDGCDLYIGRAVPRRGLAASRWGNPFSFVREEDRADVLRAYEGYVRQSPELLAALPELVGKRLGCWCKKPGQDVPCHGDVLVKLIREMGLEAET